MCLDTTVFDCFSQVAPGLDVGKKALMGTSTLSSQTCLALYGPFALTIGYHILSWSDFHVPGDEAF